MTTAAKYRAMADECFEWGTRAGGGLSAQILHLATIEAHRTLSCDFEILC